MHIYSYAYKGLFNRTLHDYIYDWSGGILLDFKKIVRVSFRILVKGGQNHGMMGGQRNFNKFSTFNQYRSNTGLRPQYVGTY